MKRRRIALVIGAFVALALLPGVASAQSAAEVDKALDECMRQHSNDPNFDPMAGPPECTIDSAGNVTRSYDSFGAEGFGSVFGTFVVIALLWSAIPLIIAATMASNRGESVGAAVLLTIFLGWIGLAIVYNGQNKTRAAAVGVLQPHSAPAYTSTDAQDPAGRLARIDQLWRDGAITDEERRDRRSAILEQL